MFGFFSLVNTELRYTERTGCCSGRLYAISMQLRLLLEIHVRSNEMWNSLARVISRCRHISFQLLSDRINNKKAAGVGSRGADSKWRELKPKAVDMLDKCLEGAEMKTTIMNEADRWTTPAPAIGVPQDSALTKEALRFEGIVGREGDRQPTATAKLWTATTHTAMNKSMPQIRADRCFRVCSDVDTFAFGDLVYIVLEKRYSLGTMLAATVFFAAPDDPQPLAKLVRPLSDKSTREFICDHFETVYNDPDAKLSIVMYKLNWNYSPQLHLHARIRDPVHVTELKKRRVTKSTHAGSPAPAPLLDSASGAVSGGAAGDGDGHAAGASVASGSAGSVDPEPPVDAADGAAENDELDPDSDIMQALVEELFGDQGDRPDDRDVIELFDEEDLQIEAQHVAQELKTIAEKQKQKSKKNSDPNTEQDAKDDVVIPTSADPWDAAAASQALEYPTHHDPATLEFGFAEEERAILEDDYHDAVFDDPKDLHSDGLVPLGDDPMNGPPAPLPPLPPPDEDPDQSEGDIRHLETWSARVKASDDAIMWRYRIEYEQRPPLGNDSTPPNLAIMSYDIAGRRDTQIVHFSTPGLPLFEGRVVNVDELTLKADYPRMVGTVLKFKEIPCEIIVHSIGVAISKSRMQEFKTDVPKEAVKIKHIFENISASRARREANTESLQDTESSCEVCGDDGSISSSSTAGPDVAHRCAFCLSVLHATCAAAFAQFIQESIKILPRSSTMTALPSGLWPAMCPICQHWFVLAGSSPSGPSGSGPSGASCSAASSSNVSMSESQHSMQHCRTRINQYHSK